MYNKLIFVLEKINKFTAGNTTFDIFDEKYVIK